MRKILFFIILLPVAVVLSLLFASKVHASPPVNFQTTQIIGSGLNGPSGFDFAPDGRIFILERTGAVKIYKNGALLAQPFTTFSTAATGDRGLIGIAFDPNFTDNHFVYFYYTGSDEFNRLVRLDASGDVASSNPLILYTTPEPSNELHVGGTIRFGPDGKLYFSVGDNGNSTNAQDLSNPYGKILRINKDGSIPTDNPYVGQSGKLPEIWANGFRNPFRFQFDSATGRIYEGDVGEATWEEVNLIQRGANYGWPTCEGTCSNTNYINPIYTYNHNGIGSAVVAGPVYHGSMFPSDYQGSLFFGDYARGFIKRLTLDSSGNATGVLDFDLNAGSVVDFKTASDGSLYYVTYTPGALYRITYSTTNHVPIAVASSDVTHGQAPLTVHFSSNGSSDPDGTALTYKWDFGDGTSSTTANPAKIYSNKGTFTAQLTVSDGVNNAQATPILIQVGTPPNLTITSPIDNAKYNAGDTLYYNSTATDGSGNNMPDSAFTTEILFHHTNHIHPFYGPVQSRTGQIQIPTTGESSADTWYEIKVTVTDSNNLSTSKSIQIFPNKVSMTFATQPTSLQVLLDGIPTNTPQTVDQVVGFQRQLSLVPRQILNNQIYGFSSWSDSGQLTHTATIPASNSSFIANFVPEPSFQAQYFNNIDLSGTPILTRQDQQINFDWGGGSPDPKVNVDNFSSRWTASQYFGAGKYKFTTTTDDGVRLYVDNQLVINNWVDQPSTSYSANINLAAGNHDIKMEYYERGGGAVAKLTIDASTDQTAPPTNTSGLTGDYYNNIDFTNKAMTRVDQNINFDWGSGSPDPQIGADTFSVRWTGQVQANYTEPYVFTASTDDGVRVWVNDTLLVDKWVDQPETQNSGIINLTAGQKYNIKMEYYENGGGAVAKLFWSSPSTPKQIIPSSALTSNGGTTNTTAFTGSYWNTPNQGVMPIFPTTTPDLVRADADINFDWGGASPDITVNPDHFVVRWIKSDNFEAATYHFSATADDGVRVYIDNNLVLDKWIDQPSTTYSFDQAMTAGIHNLKIEYYENSGGAVAKFNYVKSSTNPPPAATGLKAEYFNNIDFTNLALTRTDANINYNWNYDSPDPLIDPDTFSVRWTGKITPLYSETYNFYSTTDDGVRLWINGQLIIDQWVNQPAREWIGQITLVAGQSYDIKMEYFENNGSALAMLRWASPSQGFQVVPQDRLTPAP